MAIFISYSHANKGFVDKLCSNLLANKIHLWMDRWELRPGDSLIDSVQAALQHAGAILVILSKSYIESSWCKKEMNSGLIRELEEKGNIIIPIVIEECEIPLFFREKMYADFRSNWDDAYRLLGEALSKYINLEQGRVDTPQFHVDYSSEYISSNEKIVGLRYQFVEHAEKRPFTILSILHVFFSDEWSRRYQQYLNAGYEDVARAMFSQILIECLEDTEVKVALEDASVIRRQIEMVDKNNSILASVDFEIRWMGDDTGKTVVYWAGESIKGALKQYLTKVRKLSLEDVAKIEKIVKSRSV